MLLLEKLLEMRHILAMTLALDQQRGSVRQTWLMLLRCCMWVYDVVSAP